jgi:hypothetical protein
VRIDEALQLIALTSEIIERFLQASNLPEWTSQEIMNGLTFRVRRSGIGMEDIVEWRVHLDEETEEKQFGSRKYVAGLNARNYEERLEITLLNVVSQGTDALVDLTRTSFTKY